MSTTALSAESSEAAPAAPAAAPHAAPQHVTVIEARRGLRLLDWRDLHAYRDLLRFLVWRELKVRYAQSAVGIGWAVIQPVFSMVLFTIVFGRLANMDSDGAPYALFSLAALVPWTYFSNAVTDGVSSLVNEANTLRKVYFPRVLLPLSAVLAKLVDFSIAMGVLALLMVAYRHAPPPAVALLPLLVLLMMATALAVSVWLTALAVQYRDVKHAMTFLVQLAMYATPVVWPTSLIPERYRLAFALNPMVGVVEGFRSALLGTLPMPWDLIGVGAAVTAVVLLTGLAFFHSKERVFADVA
jgi:lipopolysaccharide transport system permease protein